MWLTLALGGYRLGGGANPALARLAQDVLTESVCLDDFLRSLAVAEGTTPRRISLVINNSCNLSCRHCYLQVPRLRDRALSFEEWLRLLDGITAWRSAQVVALSGKEPLLGSAGPDMLQALAAARSALDRPLHHGVITNGTLLLRHADALIKAQPAFIDISVDGLREDHDWIRGAGQFERLMPQLDWALENFGNRVSVCTNVNARNSHRTADLVAFLARRGVRNVGAQFFYPAAPADQALVLRPEDMSDWFRSLRAIEHIDVPEGFALDVDASVLNIEGLLAFLESDWFAVDRIEVSPAGKLFVPVSMTNGLLLRFNMTLWPPGIFGAMRITPEGDYLTAEDIPETAQYGRKRRGNVRDLGFDIEAMHQAAARDPRIAEEFRAYWGTVRPRLIASAMAAA